METLTQDEMNRCYALIEKWIGGKKNVDIDMVINLAVDKCLPSLQWLAKTGEIKGNLKQLITECYAFKSPRKISSKKVIMKDMQFNNIESKND